MKRNKHAMGMISLGDAGIELEGAPPYRFPKVISKEMALALLHTKPGDEHFIGELAAYWDKDEKQRFRLTCRDKLGQDVWLMYCGHAIKWAAVINHDNKWHLDEFNIVYSASIGSWWVHEVMVASINIRFATTARGLFTFDEFKMQYGKDITSHLMDYRDVRHDELEEVVQNINAELVEKNLHIVDPAGKVGCKKFRGLKTIDPSRWVLPAGHVFLSVADD